jgi:hypothetical protein
LKNRIFKLKEFLDKKFIFKLCQKYFLIIFRLFGSLKVFLIFLPNKYFFLQTGFFRVKSNFKLPKQNPKQALRTHRSATPWVSWQSQKFTIVGAKLKI